MSKRVQMIQQYKKCQNEIASSFRIHCSLLLNKYVLMNCLILLYESTTEHFSGSYYVIILNLWRNEQMAGKPKINI